MGRHGVILSRAKSIGKDGKANEQASKAVSGIPHSPLSGFQRQDSGRWDHSGGPSNRQAGEDPQERTHPISMPNAKGREWPYVTLCIVSCVAD